MYTDRGVGGGGLTRSWHWLTPAITKPTLGWCCENWPAFKLCCGQSSLKISNVTRFLRRFACSTRQCHAPSDQTLNQTALTNKQTNKQHNVTQHGNVLDCVWRQCCHLMTLMSTKPTQGCSHRISGGCVCGYRLACVATHHHHHHHRHTRVCR